MIGSGSGLRAPEISRGADRRGTGRLRVALFDAQPFFEFVGLGACKHEFAGGGQRFEGKSPADFAERIFDAEAPGNFRNVVESAGGE